MSMQMALAVERLPFLTRVQALEEGQRNPKFWSYLGRLMDSSDPAASVDNEMKRAAIDALDPGKYKEAGDRWPLFRSKIRFVRDRVAGHLRSHGNLEGLFDLSMLGQVPGIVTSLDQPTATSPTATTGGSVWDTIGKVLSTVGTAAASIYTAKIQTDAAKNIASTQASTLTAQQQAQQQAAQQLALQQAQQQVAVAQQQGGTSGA